MKKMLDLFSGLKGASAAFQDNPDWEVVTVDNDPDREPDILCDLSRWRENVTLHCQFENEKRENLIWASPPCDDFCRAAFPWIEYEEEPSTQLVQAAADIVALFNPDYYVIENTKSGAQWITPLLGPPRQIIGPYYLWGNFPFIPDVELDPEHKALMDPGPNNPLRAAMRARIPFVLSNALMRTLDTQQTLGNINHPG